MRAKKEYEEKERQKREKAGANQEAGVMPAIEVDIQPDTDSADESEALQTTSELLDGGTNCKASNINHPQV